MAPRDIRPAVELVDAKNQIKSPLYSRAASVTAAGRFIFTAGTIGEDRNGKLVPELQAQVAQAFANLEESLREAGARPIDIIKLTFYVVNWQWTETEQLIKSWMDLASHRPTSTLVPVPRLAYDGLFFEVEAVAAIGGLEKPFKQQDDLSMANPVPLQSVDVLVVGAGFSGTQAAHDVSKAGHSVVLIEATHRIGGRSKTVKLTSGPGVTELGGTWINKKTQPKVYATAQRLGLTCMEQYNPPNAMAVFQGPDAKVSRMRNADGREMGPTVPHGLKENDVMTMVKIIEELDSHLGSDEKVDLNNTDKFSADEDCTVADWLKRNNWTSTFVGETMGSITRALVGREPEDLGIHYLLDYIKSGLGWASLSTDDENGAQSLFIKEGSSAIAHGLAAELHPGSILLNSPVDSIDQHGPNVIVTTRNGTKFKAKKVVIAVPTNTYTKINFSPPLPRAKRILASSTKPGIYAKVVLTYARPWWRDLGLLGKFSSTIGPICFSWDLCNFETETFSLALFIAGKRAASWYELSELGREEAVLSHLTELVGQDHADLVYSVLEINSGVWSEEEWIGGAPTSAIPPRLLSLYGEDLRKPFRNLHFAGGETAREWKGYLEGALRAGSRAAEEIVAELGAKPKM